MAILIFLRSLELVLEASLPRPSELQKFWIGLMFRRDSQSQPGAEACTGPSAIFSDEVCVCLSFPSCCRQEPFPSLLELSSVTPMNPKPQHQALLEERPCREWAGPSARAVGSGSLSRGSRGTGSSSTDVSPSFQEMPLGPHNSP